MNQLSLDDAWPEELQSCGLHSEYDPEAYYETVAQWIECGCPLCLAEIVGCEM